MGNKEILQVVELFSNEKGIPKGIIFEAIEHALATQRASVMEMKRPIFVSRLIARLANMTLFVVGSLCQTTTLLFWVQS